jgi:hypothetical protein
MLGGPQGRSREEKIFSPSVEFDPWTFQLIEHRRKPGGNILEEI